MNESAMERDALAAAAEELDRAENQDDDARLATLDGVHARLTEELDKPVAEQPPN